jgi:hypothetical protein
VYSAHLFRLAPRWAGRLAERSPSGQSLAQFLLTSRSRQIFGGGLGPGCSVDDAQGISDHPARWIQIENRRSRRKRFNEPFCRIVCAQNA